MRRFFLIFFVFFSFFNFSFAQDGLVTKERNLPCINKEFSIYSHVVKDKNGIIGITEDRINEIIDGMNKYFEPICVQFKMCAMDTVHNFQYDTIVESTTFRELNVKNHATNRINVYFGNFIFLDNFPAGGFASLAGINNVNNSGIALQNIATAETFAHEMGHYFGLYHTFEAEQNGIEQINGFNCSTTGDLVCDTPADPYIHGDPLDQYIDVEMNCRFISGKQLDHKYYVPDVGNLMSYYVPCYCSFTDGQLIRMSKIYAQGSNAW